MNDSVIIPDSTAFEPETGERKPEKFSGLMGSIFPDGTVEYGGKIGKPEAFPLTEAEKQEVERQLS